MNHEGLLEKHDIATSRMVEEMRAEVWGEDGLWFVSRYLVGNNRLSERIHKPALRWAQRVLATPDGLGCDCDPRASGKTDGLTLAIPFWAYAQRPIHGTPIRGIDTCIAMVAPKKDIASYVFVVSVMERFDKCRAYSDLFPWVRPDTNNWSRKNGLRLERPSVTGAPNLIPLGMESVSTSLHPHILITDDPINEQNYRSSTEVARVRSWVEHSHALTAPEHGSRMFVGNYWTIGDVQDTVRPWKREYAHAQVWERGITGCNECVGNRFMLDKRDGDGHIIEQHEHIGELFPVALNRKEADDVQEEGEAEPFSYIEQVRAAKPTFIFLTQHENRLVDPSTLQFRKEWLKRGEWVSLADGERGVKLPILLQRYMEMRGSPDAWRFSHGGIGVGAFEVVPLSHFDIFILVDPAPSEEESAGRSQFATVVIGQERFGQMRRVVFDEYADNKPQHFHLAWLLDAYIKWRVQFRKYGIESVGYQATLRDSLLTTARGRGIGTLREQDIAMLPRLKTEGAQEDRIKFALIPLCEAGRLYVMHGLTKFIAQYDRFGIPGVKHDLLDAASNFDRTAGPTSRRGGGSGSSAPTDEARKRRSGLGPAGY